MRHERTMRIDSVDEAGVFHMTLASEGEASDGDILSMKGGQIPKRMPLLFSHWNDPTAIAGSVTSPQKELKHSPPRLRATGQIEMTGVGTLADIRRDVAMMTNKHGGAVSIRWDEIDGKPPVRRINLASDHPYFVASDDPSWRKRTGLYWENWKALEGSIVALGADPSATIGGRLYAERADETEGAVSEFWRAMADDARSIKPEMVDDASLNPVGPSSMEKSFKERRDLEKTADEDAALLQVSRIAMRRSTDFQPEAGLANLQSLAIEARKNGASASDLINAVVAEGMDGQDFEPVTIGDEQVFLPQRLAGQLSEEREARAETTALEPEPTPDPEPAEARADQPSPTTRDAPDSYDPVDVKAFGEMLGQMLDDSEERMKVGMQEILDSHTGKV